MLMILLFDADGRVPYIIFHYNLTTCMCKIVALFVLHKWLCRKHSNFIMHTTIYIWYVYKYRLEPNGTIHPISRWEQLKKKYFWMRYAVLNITLW